LTPVVAVWPGAAAGVSESAVAPPPGRRATRPPRSRVVQLSYCSDTLREAALAFTGAARRGGVLPHLPRHPQCSCPVFSSAGLFLCRVWT